MIDDLPSSISTEEHPVDDDNAELFDNFILSGLGEMLSVAGLIVSPVIDD